MKKKKNNLMTFVVVLLVVVLCLGGYLVYDKVLSSNQEKNKQLVRVIIVI